jgi:DNA modification methylase
MCGSGTTCVVARQQGRRFVGIDVSATYLAIARRRLDDET